MVRSPNGDTDFFVLQEDYIGTISIYNQPRWCKSKMGSKQGCCVHS